MSTVYFTAFPDSFMVRIHMLFDLMQLVLSKTFENPIITFIGILISGTIFDEILTVGPHLQVNFFL
jgi:hypothetical protein